MVIKHGRHGHFLLANNFQFLYIRKQKLCISSNLVAYMNHNLTFKQNGVYFYSDFMLSISFFCAPSSALHLQNSQFILLSTKAFHTCWSEQDQMSNKVNQTHSTLCYMVRQLPELLLLSSSLSVIAFLPLQCSARGAK